MIFGAETIILNLCQGINESYFNCIITCFQDPRIKNIELIEEAKRIKIQTEIIKLRNPFDIRAVFLLKKLLKKHQIDILHCHDYKSDVIGFLASKFYKVKLISTYHGWTSADVKVVVYEFLDKIIVKKFDKIIAVSEGSRNFLKNIGMPEEKLVVVGNAIDRVYFQDNESMENLRKSLAIPEDYNVVGYLGRLSPEKGPRYFIEAIPEVLKTLPLTKFLIAGDGPLKKELEDLTVSLNVEKNVIFIGRCRKEDIKKFYSTLDIFVLSSLRETASLVVMEAMAVGLPIVATRVDGPLSIIKDGITGLLVSPKDSGAIAKGIINLLSDRNKSQILARAAKDYARKEFSLSRMASKMEEVYREVINK